MKTKKRTFVALVATLAIGTVSVAGLALGYGHASAKNGLVAHAATAQAASEEALVVGLNTVNLTAGEAQTFSIDFEESGVFEFEYPYDYDEEGNKVLDIVGHATFTINGEVYVLNENNTMFAVELYSPKTAEVVIESDETIEFNFTVGYNTKYNEIAVGTNTLNLVANQKKNCIFNVANPAGYYTFTRVSGDANFEFTYYGMGDQEPETVTEKLNEENDSFTVNIITPNTTVIPVYSEVSGEVSFVITYSATDPNLQEGALTMGDNVVKATGMGEYYTFTATRAGTYELNCLSDNAFIMVEDEYGAEQILWDYEEDKYVPYTFTLAKGEKITFIMATNDWEDDTYTVNIERK